MTTLSFAGIVNGTDGESIMNGEGTAFAVITILVSLGFCRVTYFTAESPAQTSPKSVFSITIRGTTPEPLNGITSESHWKRIIRSPVYVESAIGENLIPIFVNRPVSSEIVALLVKEKAGALSTTTFPDTTGTVPTFVTVTMIVLSCPQIESFPKSTD